MESGNAYDAELDRIQQAEESAREIPNKYTCLSETCGFESPNWNGAIIHHRQTGHSLAER